MGNKAQGQQSIPIAMPGSPGWRQAVDQHSLLYRRTVTTEMPKEVANEGIPAHLGHRRVLGFIVLLCKTEYGKLKRTEKEN